MRRLVALLAAAGLALLLPAAVAAHPLGNFTINHYAGLRVGPNAIALDVVIDQAEIPTFQERQRIDANGDGQLSEQELAAERSAACPRLAGSLLLTVAGAPLALTTAAAGLSFPPGAGNLPTMRLVCEFMAALPAALGASTAIRFEDRSYAERIGWREVVLAGDRTTLQTDLPATSVSGRLTSYPQGLLAQPLNVRVAAFAARSGGPTLESWSAPDAQPLDAASTSTAILGTGGAGASSGQSVPGGVGGEIAGLLGTVDLTPLIIALSFLTAIALGAGHALTPGHGKTIMAAYLVGTRGSARHAIGLGLATAVSHTIGVLLLALLILAAGSALPADRVYPILTAVSGLIVVAIGAWLLATQATRWLRATRRPVLATAASAEAIDSDHGHEHGHERDGHLRDVFGGRHAAMAGSAQAVAMAPNPDLHRHGWRAHRHVPSTTSAGSTALSWRSLFALGLSGGLVPSTNALLILIATVAAGRAPYGFVLVVAFGLGMAAVLVGVGLALVYASGMVSRAPRAASWGRLFAFAPTLAAVAVLCLGIYLTAGALSGSPVL